MSDLIDRQDAINAIYHHFPHMSMKLAATVLHEVPSAQQWIPCSERLPELNESGYSEMVLLCWSDGQVTVGAYAGNRTFCGQAWPEAKDARVIVAAWMPLPGPYEEDTDDR